MSTLPRLCPRFFSFRPATQLASPLASLRSSRATVRPRTYSSAPADRDSFVSILDKPPVIVRAGKKKHGPGLLLLIAIPVTAFGLGTWQVKRLEWKTDLIARYEDRLVRPPLPLPPKVDTSNLEEFDYRRIYATGTFRHDQEMLVGPRVREGENGFSVVTPLERKNGTTVLINRGWINKKKMNQKDRLSELPQGEVTVEGLLRSPWKKNMFTPQNRPDLGEFYFPDVEEMAALVGAQPVWIEETTVPDLIVEMDNEAKGKPIARPAEVNIRNNHLQYIFTWYGLSVATSIMLWMLLRKAPAGRARQVRHSKDWS